MFAHTPNSIMIRTGIFGSGKDLETALETLGRHSGFLLTGFHSGSSVLTRKINVPQFYLPEELISVSEALIITNNPGDFYEVMPVILKNSRHLLIFPDHSLSFYQLDNLIKLAEEAGVVLYLHQGGITDWMRALSQKYCTKPEFIQVYTYIDKTRIVHGKGIFDALYLAVSDVIRLNPVNLRKFHTNLVPYCSPDPLMTNVRLEFENSTSANITINGFFQRTVSRIELFRNDTQVIIESSTPEVRVIRKNPNSSRVFNKPAEGEIDTFSAGINAFALRLFSPGLNSDPFESGIIAHKNATRIIHQYIPYPSRII